MGSGKVFASCLDVNAKCEGKDLNVCKSKVLKKKKEKKK